MTKPTLAELGFKPLCPTVIGSSAFPGWYAYFQDQAAASPSHFGAEDLAEARLDATRLALEDQVRAGIELVTDGEMGRVDFNLGFYDYLSGLDALPAPRKLGVPAHDQRPKYRCVGPLSAPDGLGTLAEYRTLKDLTRLPIKMPIPGPFTLAGRIEGGQVYADRQAVTEALIPIVNAEIRALIGEGCRFIQLDEPSFACHPDDPGAFVDIINRTLEGTQEAYISMHMCFGNYRGRAVGHRSYRPLFPGLLEAEVDQLALEFASRELAEIDLLKPIFESGKSIAVGLVDVKNLWIEPVELIVERLHVCLQYAPADALHVSADCGYSQTARYAAVRKMAHMAQAVQQVRAEQDGRA
jgi:5-methyltetrahydropteroyltriglutamate--homocysteine methyltransferase